MLSQGDSTADPSARDIYMAFIKERDHKPGNVYLHPTHRLDRPVSGCLLMAKTSKGLSRMTQLFKSRDVHKKYIAISTSRDRDRAFGETLDIRGFIRKDKRNNRVEHKSKPFADAKSAQTLVTCLAHVNGYFVLSCEPKTGRSHQIRVQLASVGLPIVGDVKYGGEKYKEGFIHLHAHGLRFEHPIKKEQINIECQVPGYGLWHLVP